MTFRLSNCSSGATGARDKNFWTLWCKGRLTEADTPTIRVGAIPSGQSSAHLHHPPHFLQAGFPSCRPINSVKALKATKAELIKSNNFLKKFQLS